MTIADFMAPNIVVTMGGPGKTSGRYTLFGVIFPCFVGLNCVGGGPITAATGVLGAIPSCWVYYSYWGSYTSEDASGNSKICLRKNHRPYKAGLSYMVGLGISMIGKVVYATLGFGLAIAQVLLN